MRSRRPDLADRGFTLVEVMVALMIMSVMAATAFKGVDAILRSREIAEGQLQRTLRLQSVMAQWEMDMAAVADTGSMPDKVFEFDGARLRLVRSAPGGVQVVLWSFNKGMWLRWASPVTTRVGELESHWERSYRVEEGTGGTLVALRGVQQWMVYCYRRLPGQQGGWSNCQSSSQQAVPQGLRSVLSLGEGSGFQGVVNRDVLVAPQPG